MLEEEIHYIKKFFEGIDYEVSKIMKERPNVFEEHLTFTLGNLLNSETSMNKNLEYDLSDLNEKLRDLGSSLYIKFDTNEHSKHLEGNKTFADLGIIVKIERPLETIEKGILVQCKRLYPVNDEFSLNSKYEGFNKKQFNDIKEMVNKGLKCCYLFYNPILSVFNEKFDIFTYENDSSLLFSDQDKFDFITSLKNRPGMKITSIDFIDALCKDDFSLKDCYELSVKFGGTDFKFFSSFIIDLLKCNYRIEDKKLLNEQLLLCKGKKSNSEYFFKKGIPAKGRIEIGYKSKRK